MSDHTWGPDQEVTRTDDVENSLSTTQAVGDVGQTPDGAHVDNPLDASLFDTFSVPVDIRQQLHDSTRLDDL